MTCSRISSGTIVISACKGSGEGGNEGMREDPHPVPPPCERGREAFLSFSPSLILWLEPLRGSSHLARILRLRRLYRLERLLGPGHRAHNVEDIPLVLRAGFVLYLHHVHLLQQLVIPRAEAA